MFSYWRLSHERWDPGQIAWANVSLTKHLEESLCPHHQIHSIQSEDDTKAAYILILESKPRFWLGQGQARIHRDNNHHNKGTFQEVLNYSREAPAGSGTGHATRSRHTMSWHTNNGLSSIADLLFGIRPRSPPLLPSLILLLRQFTGIKGLYTKLDT